MLRNISTKCDKIMKYLEANYEATRTNNEKKELENDDVLTHFIVKILQQHY